MARQLHLAGRYTTEEYYLIHACSVCCITISDLFVADSFMSLAVPPQLAIL